jgi:hypothetical protein
MQTYTEGFDACSHNSNAGSEVDGSFDSGSQRHQSYWTPTNVTAPSGMTVLHIIFDETDSTFKLGNKGLKACIENANDKGGTIICHPVRNIPIGKNGTVDTGYFIIPKTNETLIASGQVDFNGIRVGTKIDDFETHLNLPSTVYSDVGTGIWCQKYQKVKVNTPAMSECIIRHD